MRKHQAQPARNAYEALGLDKDDTPRRKRDDLPAERRQKAVPRRVKVVPYQVDTSIKAPQVGEGLAVCHRSEVQPNGSVRLVRSNVDHRRIKRVYMSDSHGFSIQDHLGESWYVRPASIGSSQWETFTPGEKQKVLK